MKTTKLLSYLDYLGIKPTMESFNDRKKMQKISYLFSLFNLDIDLNPDDYNWYLHGPYSPDLTKTLFQLIENPPIFKRQLSQIEIKKLEQMKNFLGEDINSDDTLELLVSLHFLLRAAQDSGDTIDNVIKILKEKKPYFKYNEIKSALRKLETLS